MNEVVQLRPKPQEETDFGELIQLYLETRDAKEALEKMHKQHLRRYTSVMAKIEGKLMTHLNEHNVQSLASKDAIAYLSTKRAASIRDATAFQNYVIENRAWDMLDWKANVTAVGDFITENEHAPPGVVLNSVVVLRIARN
jgi:hypothetical protein